ncbi:Hemolymph lipopolysaccharide-binding protein [Papilio machaon]|uniref:Hemolymph lipopolysaccharide-binding protein n=1 Tax=Papilio machaon TaxID=76193 RepID=A0A194RMJ4_PAPMA|nr:Hemolymph lipopolysaccharide-binding protein [Papilio machaon]
MDFKKIKECNSSDGRDYLSYRYNNNTYKIYSPHLKWQTALEKCASKEWELFYPKNEKELIIAKKLMTEMELKHIFVGITSKDKNGVFATIDGRYNDDDCSHQFSYICTKRQPRLDVTNRDSSVPAEKSKEKFFRNDYKYLGHKDSFYKAHPTPRQWESARRKCIMEGASLFYPEDGVEVHEVNRYLNQTQPWFQYMFIGISTRLANGVYMTVDGESIRNVYNEWYRKVPSGANGRHSCVTLSREGFLNDIKCSEERPFVCKKKAASIEWNIDCNVPYKDYKYNANTGICYKFHLQRLNWRDALEACDDEQAKLAIINTVEEANYLANISNNTPKEMVQGWYLCPYVHLGYHYDTTENDWRTIEGESLEKTGYAVWDNYQIDGEDERCGAMLYNGRLNDVSCENLKCFFVCEIEDGYRNFNLTSDIR